MKLQQPLISIIIPCGRNLKMITLALVTLDAYFAKHSFSYELILIPHTSALYIKEVLHRFISLIPHARIQEIKGGYEGVAIQKGMLEARGLIRIYMNPANASSINFYEGIEQWFRKGYDVVVGSRISTAPSAIRVSFYERAFQWFMQHLLTPLISDADGGWAAYSQKSATMLFPHTIARSTTVIRESIALAQSQKLRVKELYSQDFITTSSQNTSSYIQGICEAFRIKFKLVVHSYPLKKIF